MLNYNCVNTHFNMRQMDMMEKKKKKSPRKKQTKILQNGSTRYWIYSNSILYLSWLKNNFEAYNYFLPVRMSGFC